jgi:hypothetical protein
MLDLLLDEYHGSEEMYLVMDLYRVVHVDEWQYWLYVEGKNVYYSDAKNSNLDELLMCHLESQ